MIKFYEIGQIEKLAIGDGTVKAATGGTKNCFLGKVDNGVAAAFTAGAELTLFANYGDGDDMHTEFVTPAGELVTAWKIAHHVGKCLEVSPDSITYTNSKTYADITVGAKYGVGTDGNIAVGATAPTSGIVFEVVKKINFDGNGILVKVVDLGTATNS